MSLEFITDSFANRKVRDTIYVSTDGFYPTLKDEINAEVYQHIDLPRDATDNITMHPETVTKVAIEANDDNPDRRLIIHYLQPHQSCIGEFGHSKFEFEGNLKDSIRESQVTKEGVRTAYTENLNIVLDRVAILNEPLNGRVVVTADHGEMLDERIRPFKLYGHFRGVYRDELVKIPWHVLGCDSKGDIIIEEPVSDMVDLDDKELNQHSRNLGYKV